MFPSHKIQVNLRSGFGRKKVGDLNIKIEHYTQLVNDLIIDQCSQRRIVTQHL